MTYRQIGRETLPLQLGARGVWGISELHDARISNAWPFVPPPEIKTPRTAARDAGATAHWGMEENTLYVETILADGPIAHWGMGDWRDEVGGHNGSFFGSPEVGVQGGTHRSLGTRFFNEGSDDYLQVPHDDSLSLTEFTVELWIRVDKTGPDWRGIISKGKGQASDRNYAMFLRADTSQIHASFHDGVGYNSFDSNSDLPIGEWAHLAHTFDGSEQRIYVNGTLDATDQTSESPALTTEPLYVGYFPAYEGARASMSNIAIYPYALSPRRLREHHGAGRRIVDYIGSSHLSGEEDLYGPPIAAHSRGSLAQGQAVGEIVDDRTDDLSIEFWATFHEGSGDSLIFFNGHRDDGGS